MCGPDPGLCKQFHSLAFMLLKQAAHTVAWDQGKRPPPFFFKKRQGLYYVALVGLEFTAVNLPVSASRGLGLNVCAIMPD